MNITIVGHTGFLGTKLLDYLNEINLRVNIVGISLDKIEKTYPNLTITEKETLDSEIDQDQDFVIFLSHAQNWKNVLKAEKALAEEFISFIKKNSITCPIILVRSVGWDSKHIRSRILFNETVKRELNNKIIEIRATVISEPGSISYEIPYRVIQKMRIIPQFPWFKSKVSLIKCCDLVKRIVSVIKGEILDQTITPDYETMTYKDYILRIAKEQDKKLKTIKIPFNDFLITPGIVSKITDLDKNEVKNLMQTLKHDAVL